jgi:hypothetical protein
VVVVVEGGSRKGWLVLAVVALLLLESKKMLSVFLVVVVSEATPFRSTYEAALPIVHQALQTPRLAVGGTPLRGHITNAGHGRHNSRLFVKHAAAIHGRSLWNGLPLALINVFFRPHRPPTGIHLQVLRGADLHGIPRFPLELVC